MNTVVAIESGISFLFRVVVGEFYIKAEERGRTVCLRKFPRAVHLGVG